MMEFEITVHDLPDEEIDNWEFAYDYHYLYILENGKDVYIGETNDVITRTKQHFYPSDPCYPYKFNRIYVITCREFEETRAKHYEALLIKLMFADNKFHVTNLDKKRKRIHYERKNEFELGFDRLWVQLGTLGLVNHRTFQAVINSDRYKYSPYTALTEEQTNALNSIFNILTTQENKPHKKRYLHRPILIEGDAGTGKTVVATTLFYYLKSHPDFGKMKIGMVYANTATRYEVEQLFKSIPGVYAKDIIKPIDVTKEKYDILICDEAHRLRRKKNLGLYSSNFSAGNERMGLDNSHDELDWLLRNTDCLILFYDRKQIVSACDISYHDFFAWLKDKYRGIRPVELNSQMRIRAGDRYVPYIFDLLEQNPTSALEFDNYDFQLFSSLQDMVMQLQEKEKTFGLCRMCSGYAWQWSSKKDVSIPDITIDGVDIWWNKQCKGWIENEAAKNDMGSIYAIPGLDLNYAGVVIGPDVYYDRADHTIKVDRKHFFDHKVKDAVSDEELKRFVLNTYAHFLTRGIYGTYVYVCDDALREYLSQFIPTV